ncbi:IS66 family insertion sequence element accessory protein TnpA [Cupriavidus necator]|uniref:IS66 family insertion sequence element accessory protein TnpA n=1 Tax=Cupriavidus necator TaxID=106590 RepID=UPI003F50C359
MSTIGPHQTIGGNLCQSLLRIRGYRKEPRRRFSSEYKCQVVRALLSSTMSLARFAREHDLNHNQLARWHREYEQGKYGAVAEVAMDFVPVCVEPMLSSPPPVLPTSSAMATVELHLPQGRIVMHNVSQACLHDLSRRCDDRPTCWDAGVARRGRYGYALRL